MACWSYIASWGEQLGVPYSAMYPGLTKAHFGKTEQVVRTRSTYCLERMERNKTPGKPYDPENKFKRSPRDVLET